MKELTGDELGTVYAGEYYLAYYRGKQLGIYKLARYSGNGSELICILVGSSISIGPFVHPRLWNGGWKIFRLGEEELMEHVILELI